MLVQLGFCRKVHGIKGGFVFSLFNEDQSVLKNNTKIFIKNIADSNESNNNDNLSNQKEVTIEKISFGNKVITYLKNINDRSCAEEILPFEIWVNREDFPDLKDDEVYLNDLIGFNIIDFNSKEIIGKLDNFIETPAQTNIEILLLNNELLTIPYIDNFIKEVDIDNSTIKVIVPEIV